MYMHKVKMGTVTQDLAAASRLRVSQPEAPACLRGPCSWSMRDPETARLGERVSGPQNGGSRSKERVHRRNPDGHPVA